MTDKSRLEARATAEWSRIAREPVDVVDVAGALYAFGSELATLRLFKVFHPVGRAGWSANRGSFYFTTEAP